MNFMVSDSNAGAIPVLRRSERLKRKRSNVETGLTNSIIASSPAKRRKTGSSRVTEQDGVIVSSSKRINRLKSSRHSDPHPSNVSSNHVVHSAPMITTLGKTNASSGFEARSNQPREARSQPKDGTSSESTPSHRKGSKRLVKDDDVGEMTRLLGDNETRPAKRTRTATDNVLNKTKIIMEDMSQDANSVLARPVSKIEVQVVQDTKVRHASSIIYKLPLEVLYLIVEQLWDNDTDQCHWYDTLCACTLVCSRWRAAPRPLIFRHIILKSSAHIHKLAPQIHNEPKIAHWIRKLRFEGISVPKRWFLLSTSPSKVKEDRDIWMYSFSSDIGTRLPNIKTLEIFGFQHLSQRREDWEAFARWIPQLATLDSVESLHLARCEIPYNALASIIRAFPALHDMSFTCVCFANSNGVELIETSSSHIGSSASHSEAHGDIVKYPMLHTFPRLRSLLVDNSLADYSMFDLKTHRQWLCPRLLDGSLQDLRLRGNINPWSLSEFIVDLGTLPSLKTLGLPMEITETISAMAGLDISKLNSIRKFILYSDVGINAGLAEYACQLFAQVNNAHLEEVTVQVIKINGLEHLNELDKLLCGEKFRVLKRVNVSISKSRYLEKEPWEPVKLAKKLFPNMEARGILRVIEPPPPSCMP